MYRSSEIKTTAASRDCTQSPGSELDASRKVKAGVWAAFFLALSLNGCDHNSSGVEFPRNPTLPPASKAPNPFNLTPEQPSKAPNPFNPTPEQLMIGDNVCWPGENTSYDPGITSFARGLKHPLRMMKRDVGSPE